MSTTRRGSDEEVSSMEYGNPGDGAVDYNDITETPEAMEIPGLREQTMAHLKRRGFKKSRVTKHSASKARPIPFTVYETPVSEDISSDSDDYEEGVL